MIRIALVLSLVTGCKLGAESTPDPMGSDTKGDDGQGHGAHFKAIDVLLSAEEPIVALELALGVNGPVTIRISPRGARYTDGKEWEEDFLERYRRNEVSGEECIEGFHVSGSALASTSVQLCLVPIVGLASVEKIAHPNAVTANAIDGRVSLEFYAAPAATRTGHEETWFYVEAIW
jgi:hypothetical protein